MTSNYPHEIQKFPYIIDSIFLYLAIFEENINKRQNNI